MISDIGVYPVGKQSIKTAKSETWIAIKK